MSPSQECMEALGVFIDESADIRARFAGVIVTADVLGKFRRGGDDGVTALHATVQQMCSSARVDAVFEIALRSAATLRRAGVPALKAKLGECCRRGGRTSLEVCCELSEGVFLLSYALKILVLVSDHSCGISALCRRAAADLVRMSAAAVMVADCCHGINASKLADELCFNAAKLLNCVTLQSWASCFGLVRAGFLPIVLRLMRPRHMLLESRFAAFTLEAFNVARMVVKLAQRAQHCPETAADARDTLRKVSDLPFYPTLLDAMLHRNAFMRLDALVRMEVMWWTWAQSVVGQGGWSQLQADRTQLLQRAIVMYGILAQTPPQWMQLPGLGMQDSWGRCLEVQHMLKMCASGSARFLPQCGGSAGAPAKCWEASLYRKGIKEDERRVCPACEAVKIGDEGAMQRCGRCRVTWYCNAACQKAHWKVHKVTCVEQAPTSVHATSSKQMKKRMEAAS